MFNSVNNPFGNRRVESSTSSDKNGGQQHQQERKEQKKNLFDEKESDEIKFDNRPVMTEDDILYMVEEYINRLKEEFNGDEKLTQKADRWLEKFDVHKFMKNNPNITISDFNMIMYMETEPLRK